uniref:Uncharacterized protein n=1 Tax=Anguilla anguilla TaxID=7936 RepID=A0A0E9PT09_ANGAN
MVLSSKGSPGIKEGVSCQSSGTFRIPAVQRTGRLTLQPGL